jgi:hypothetical protein
MFGVFVCRHTAIDLIQKLTNQQGQKLQLFFHFRFSIIILSVLNSLTKLTFEVKFIMLPFQIIFPVPDFRCPSSNLQYGTLQSHPPPRSIIVKF